MTLANAILDTRGPWLHSVAATGLEEIRGAAEKAHILVVRLSGTRMRSLDELFHEYSREFRFPEYFGSNWSAFYECMTELEGRPAPGFLTLISDADQLLSRDPNELPTFTRQLESIGRRWADAFGLLGPEWGRNSGEIPFHTILVEASGGSCQEASGFAAG